MLEKRLMIELNKKFIYVIIKFDLFSKLVDS